MLKKKAPRNLTLALLLGVSLSAVAWAQNSARPTPSTGDARVDGLLAQMTLAEKISLVHGAIEPDATNLSQAGYLPGVPRLGIPSLRLSDGPPGVLIHLPSTAMTSTMGLAATFSRADAQANGKVIGQDARALGIDIVLEPFINIHRDQGFGRAYNTFGEDPLLTGQIAAAQITGTQAQGVMSQAKHYIAYDGSNDVTVAPQALHEIYLAPFADVIAANVSSIMCSYNKINGAYACGNNDTLNRNLRDEMGFKGFVTSDWGGVHATDFIAKGDDLEMPGEWAGNTRAAYFAANVVPPVANAAPGGGGFGGGGGIPEEPPVVRAGGGGGPGGAGDPPSLGMLAALQAGTVDEATITRAAGRILYEMDRFGFLQSAPKHDVTPEDVEGHAPILRKTAQDAAVLLKNEDRALPLKPADLVSLAVIGPGGGQLIAIGASGEKALGHIARQVSPLDAIKAAAPRAHITYAVANDMTGVAIPASVLTHDGQPGLARTGAAGSATTVDAQLDFTKAKANALPGRTSATWSGQITVPSDGIYQINLQLLGAAGSFSIDDKVVGRSARLDLHGGELQPGQDNVLPTVDGLDNVRKAVNLTAGPHKLSVQITGDASGDAVQVRLAWITPEQKAANYAAATAAAKSVHTPVVFAWGRNNPNFGLPGDQDRLISDIAAVNPNTIVVLNVSEPIAMPWLSKVKAVLQMWYPGDEGGWATADILTGKVSPAGRLPFTWPQKLTDNVSYDPAHPERASAGVNGKTDYSEGIFVGYRWFDQQNIAPLYPFGYGQSYTKFAYSNLSTKRAADGGLDVSFRLRNMGAMDADEVPQVYLGAPASAPAGAQFAIHALAAFDRLHLKAGESKNVTLHVAVRSLYYWDAQGAHWSLAAGNRPLYVGASSRDLQLKTMISVR